MSWIDRVRESILLKRTFPFPLFFSAVTRTFKITSSQLCLTLSFYWIAWSSQILHQLLNFSSCPVHSDFPPPHPHKVEDQEGKRGATWFHFHFNMLHSPPLNTLRRSENIPVVCLNFRLQCQHPWSSIEGGTCCCSLLPWGLHLPGIDTCALRIVPANSAFHRCSLGEGPAIVLRASGEKGSSGPGFFSLPNVVFTNASAKHGAIHLPGLFSLRLEETSPRGICILRWNSSKLHKPALRGGKKKKRRRRRNHWKGHFKSNGREWGQFCPLLPLLVKSAPRNVLS